jgi:hypothetical protein
VLEPGDRSVVDDAYEHVFRPAFDATELPSISEVTPAPGRLVLVALEGSIVLAGAVSDTIPESDIGLLSYMAARADRRSRGVGSMVLAAMRDKWTKAAVDLVLAEVRDPRVWESSDAERPRDRLRFYARNACQLVPAPWVQPAIDNGGREAGMLLLAVHGGALGRSVDAERLTNWAARYYAETEGREPGDPQYRALIERLGAGDLELMPIDAYESVPQL